jgi:uncharacterized membrane protein
MESLDSRLKRIEQRLSSIEKFIAENVNTSRNKDMTVRLGRVSEPVEVSSEYRYNYGSDIDSSLLIKVPLHQVDSSVFNQRKSTHLNEDMLVTAVSGIILVLALFFLGRFLVDASWLTPTSQIAFGAVLGLGFITTGYSLRESSIVGMQYLPLVGLALLYVSIFGATNYYHLMPKNAGLVAVLVVSWLGLFVNREFNLDIYQILAVVGAYLVPLYISYEAELVYANLYYLVTSLSFMLFAVALRLNTVAILGAYLAIAVCGITDYFDNDSMNLVLFTLGHFVIYASGYLLTAVRSEEEISRVYTYLFFPFVLLFYIFEFYYLGQISHKTQEIFGVLFGISMIGCYMLVKTLASKKPVQLTQTLLLMSSAAVFAHIVFYNLLPDKMRAIGLIVMGVALFKAAPAALTQNRLLSKAMTYFFLVLAAVSGFEVILAQFNSQLLFNYINAVIYAVVLFYVAFFETHLAELKIDRRIATGAAHLFILTSLYSAFSQKTFPVILGVMGGYAVLAVALFFHQSQKMKATANVDPVVIPNASNVTDISSKNEQT